MEEWFIIKYFNDEHTEHAHNGLTQKGNGQGKFGLYSRLSFVTKCRTPSLDKTVHCLYKFVKNIKFIQNEIWIVALILKSKQQKWRCFKHIISSMFISQARGQMRTSGNLGFVQTCESDVKVVLTWNTDKITLCVWLLARELSECVIIC